MQRAAVVASILLILAGCGGSGGGGGAPPPGGPPTTPTGAASGRIDFFVGAPGLVLDREPNDLADAAQPLGELPIGGRLTVLGAVDAATDPLDGYLLRSSYRARLRVEIAFEDPVANDLELALFEPVSMQYVVVETADVSPSALLTEIRGPIHVVVRARAGASRYELRIAVDPGLDPLDEREPNAPDGEAAWLGNVDPGDVVRITGSASALTDADEAFLMLVPHDVSLDVALTHPAFTDYDVLLFDATADLAAPLPLATLADSSTSPETGVVDVDAPTLLLVVVHATSGQGAWELRLAATARAATASRLRVAPPTLAERATEIRRLRLPAGAAVYGRGRGDVVAGEIVVPEEDGSGRLRLQRVEVPGDLDAEDGERFTLSRAALLAARGARWAEPNRRVQALVEPNDTYYGYQWHYEQIGLPQAWEITTGSSSVIVAVIDTGRTEHPDLQGRQIGGYDFISSPTIAGDGDGIDPDPTDVGDGGGSGLNSWHGTHVAGTVGASTNDGRGVAGTTWSTQIMHLRALGIGGGTSFDIANAIRYAAGLSNSSGATPPQAADVINMSLGSPSFSTAMRDACDAAKQAGVVIVAAAGNDATTAPSYPAAYDSVISVVAVDAGKSLAYYSNRGTTVDLAAPGGDLRADVTGDGYPDGVLSTLWDDSTNPKTPVYAFYQGTSMAAPHVAGVAALVLSMDPDLTPDEVQTLLESTAEDLGAAGRDTTYGWGLVDAFAAVSALRVEEPQGPPVLDVSPDVLNFGAALTTLGVGIRNTGGGALAVGPVTVRTEDGGDWLEVDLLPSADASTDVAGLEVRVARAGLLPGTYLGHIDIASNGGQHEVAVAATVELTLPPPSNLDIHVLAVRADTGQVVGRTTVNPQSSLAFAFPVLPVGDYLLFAGTDFDGDGELGEPGDYFGAWPSEQEPQIVTIIQQEEVVGLDFPVLFGGTLGAEAHAR